MRRTAFYLSVLLSAVPASAFAERPHVLGPVPGYQCMMLNITEAQAMDPTFHPPVYAAPSGTASVFGYAGLEVAVRNPPHMVNGFNEVLYPTGEIGWMRSNLLRAYHSLGDPSAKCVPVMLSNGQRGFDFPH